MIGAIVGDIVGSRFEFNNHKFKDFDLFGPGCTFTDDTVLTVAVADWLLNGAGDDLVDYLTTWSQAYPHCSYGALFQRWLSSPEKEPYNSYGNGAAMRVSPCGWFSDSIGMARFLAVRSAEVTHNHPEGIKGARATVLAIMLARQGFNQHYLYNKIRTNYHYDLTKTVDEIREDYSFDETCQGTVPQAMVCAFDARDFEDAIRNAISIGGDSDTVAAIAGSIAEAIYGVPDDIREKALSYLPDDMLKVVDQFADLQRVETVKMTNDIDSGKQRANKWLADNLTVVSEVRSIVLSKFSWNSEGYVGHFYVAFDGVEYPDSFSFSLGASDGITSISNSTYGQYTFHPISLPVRVSSAIANEILAMFPRITPYGRNRKTKIDVSVSTPIQERIPDPGALSKTIETITDPDFEIRIEFDC